MVNNDRYTGTFYSGRSRLLYQGIENEYNLPIAVDVKTSLVSDDEVQPNWTRLYLSPSRSQYVNYGNGSTIKLDASEWGRKFMEMFRDGSATLIIPPIINLSGHALNFYANYAGEEVMVVPPHGVINAAREIVEAVGNPPSLTYYIQRQAATPDGLKLMEDLRDKCPLAILVGSIVSSSVYGGLFSPYPVMQRTDSINRDKLAHIDKFLSIER